MKVAERRIVASWESFGVKSPEGTPPYPGDLGWASSAPWLTV
jgi:hypothetical protein